MTRDTIIARLRASDAELRLRGLTHVAVSIRARGENCPDSDADIMIDVDPKAQIAVDYYMGLKGYIAGVFDGPVDVVSREVLKTYVRPSATADAVYAL